MSRGDTRLRAVPGAGAAGQTCPSAPQQSPGHTGLWRGGGEEEEEEAHGLVPKAAPAGARWSQRLFASCPQAVWSLVWISLAETIPFHP